MTAYNPFVEDAKAHAEARQNAPWSLSKQSNIVADATTGTRTATIEDVEGYVRLTGAAPISFVIPPDSDVDFPDNAIIEGEQAGAGPVTITPGAGVTIRSRDDAFTTAGQYSPFAIRKVGPNEWTLAGDVA
jgi:hypothetical protein